MYDPLVDTALTSGQPMVDSYWADTTKVSTRQAGLQTDLATDVLVIGAGYSGLSCAYELSQRFGRAVTVLEANQPGWGCSGRNAGFVLRGTGRLGLAQLKQRYGIEVARRFHAEYGDAVALVRDRITLGNIDCAVQENGYFKVAHKASLGRQLPQRAAMLLRDFDYPAEFISEPSLKTYMHNTQAFGAIRFPDCFGVNPLALVQGYAALAEKAGAQLYHETPVLGWQRHDGGFTVQTPAATVECKQIVLATNAYTAKGFYPALNTASLPVLSSVIVTEPMTEAQLQGSGLMHGQLVMDTRALKYYYRKLPDNRILFGGRSAVHGKDASDPVYPARLLSALKSCFPALHDIKLAYHWCGWISVSLDDMPRICQIEPDVFYAAGYCGSGLSFSTLAGKRLAQFACGETLPALPIYQSALKPFPMPEFRRLGQQAYYQWGRFKDRFL